MNDLILIESQSARTERMSGVTDELAVAHLNKAKALTMALWKGKGVATTKQLAEYYEVSEDTVRSTVFRNKEEFDSDGLYEAKGEDLKAILAIGHDAMQLPESTTRLTIWTPRAAIRLGMMLRDSPIAKAVRTLILDIVSVPPTPDHNLPKNFEEALEMLLASVRENNHLKQELYRIVIDMTAIKEQVNGLTKTVATLKNNTSQPQTTRREAPVQTELELGIEQRFNASKQSLMKARTLENEHKAAEIERKALLSTEKLERHAIEIARKALLASERIARHTVNLENRANGTTTRGRILEYLQDNAPDGFSALDIATATSSTPSRTRTTLAVLSKSKLIRWRKAPQNLKMNLYSL